MGGRDVPVVPNAQSDLKMAHVLDMLERDTSARLEPSVFLGRKPVVHAFLEGVQLL